MNKNSAKSLLIKGMALAMMAGCTIGAQIVHAEEEHLKIGFGVPFLANDFFSGLKEDLTALAEADGNEVKTYVFDGDFSKQISQMEDMASDNCNVIVSFMTTDSVIDTARILKEQGETVVILGGGIPDESVRDSADYFLSQVDYEMGHLVAEAASEWIDETFPDAEDGSLEFAVISTTFSPNASSNSDGLKAIEELNPKAKIVEFYDMGTSSDGSMVQSYANQAINAHPDLCGFFCYDAAWAEFANQEIINYPGADLNRFGIFFENISEQTFDLINDCAQGKSTSALRATVSNQFQYAEMIYKACLKELETDDDNFVKLPLTTITCANVSEFLEEEN